MVLGRMKNFLAVGYQVTTTGTTDITKLNTGNEVLQHEFLPVCYNFCVCGTLAIRKRLTCRK